MRYGGCVPPEANELPGVRSPDGYLLDVRGGLARSPDDTRSSAVEERSAPIGHAVPVPRVSWKGARVSDDFDVEELGALPLDPEGGRAAQIHSLKARIDELEHERDALRESRELVYRAEAKAVERAEKAEDWADGVIEERDHRVRQIEDAAAELGLGVEWSNMCDVGDEVVEAAAAITQRAEQAEAERDRLAAEIMGLRLAAGHDFVVRPPGPFTQLAQAAYELAEAWAEMDREEATDTSRLNNAERAYLKIRAEVDGV